MGNHPITTPGTGGLTRRTFLGVGGALFGSALLLRPNAPSQPSALARLAAQGGPQLPLAYVRDTEGITAEEIRALLAAGGAQAVPAVKLRSGGAPAGEGAARIRVEGGALGLPTRAITGAQFDALLEHASASVADDPLVPYYAWTYQGGTAGQAGQGVGFVVPFNRGPSVGFALRSRTDEGKASASSWTASRSVLTGGADPGLAKLREGAYVVSLAPGAGPLAGSLPAAGDPAWASRPSLVFTVHAV